MSETHGVQAGSTLRRDVDVHHRITFRFLAWTRSIIGAAAAVVAILIATSGTSPDGSPPTAGPASCVAPFLRADPQVAPPEPGHPSTFGVVRTGTNVTVYGHWFYGGRCSDGTTHAGTSPNAAGPVRLLLTTSDDAELPLATVQPDDDASFAAVVTVPATAARGPAIITDGLRELVKLVIVAN